LSTGVATRQEEQQQQQQKPTAVTIPTGTRLVIRTSETLDTKRQGEGHRFRSQLESALVIDGITVAPRGTQIYGRITSVNQANRLAGSSDISIVFTDIMIDDQLHSMQTQGLKAQAKNEAGRTARAAALGGLHGGSSSAKKGAKVGLVPPSSRLAQASTFLQAPSSRLTSLRL
jgi:hypothetical protein